MIEAIVWSIFFGFGFFLFWFSILEDKAPDGIIAGSGLVLAAVVAYISFVVSTHLLGS
ncbi:hypothetical protein [Persephonella sp. KM09-Lau-8]|uniref:hypothetical protein n=1 Tax=Persephonella sp. KM09-Lau-8 TaxID=1158345 RepID=UPI0012DC4135|nr:hypothetical protein [Persephonella sp. KM09-Lau-8]